MGLEIVDYRYGKAAGTVCGKAVCFKGIPYAEPPVGALRWRRTEPLRGKRWEGVRTFDRFGKICPQRHPKIQIPEEEMSEDCLYLNIWTPAESPDDRLPVLVWFHGGSFVFGFSSEPLYSAEQMASKGIVVVTVNYRLGRFGFFTHPELDAETEEKISGNYGLWDQVQALKWVRENIAAFGGSPDQVTIAGQSAGGASVSALLGFPEAEGLFQGGIIESGVHDTDKLNCTLEEAEKDCMGFLASCGKDRFTIEQLREISWQELMEIDMPIWVNLKPPLRPVIDGVVQPMQSYDMFRLAKIHDVPLIFGTNGAEGNMGPRGCDYNRFMDFLTGYAGEYLEEFLRLYPVNRNNFETVKHTIGRDKEFANLRFLSKKLSDGRRSPVYHYFFDQPVPQEDGSVIEPSHHMELYYVWNQLSMQPGRPVIEKKHQVLAEHVQDYWVNFVKHGDPNGTGLPKWPPCTKETGLHLHIHGDCLIAQGSYYPEGTGLIETLMERAEILHLQHDFPDRDS